MNQLLNSSYNERYVNKELQQLPRDIFLRFLLSAVGLVFYISSDGSLTEGELLSVVEKKWQATMSPFLDPVHCSKAMKIQRCAS